MNNSKDPFAFIPYPSKKRTSQKENMLSILVHLDVSWDKLIKRIVGHLPLVSLVPLTPSFFSLYSWTDPSVTLPPKGSYTSWMSLLPAQTKDKIYTSRQVMPSPACSGWPHLFLFPTKVTRKHRLVLLGEILVFCSACYSSWNTPFVLSATPNPPYPWGLSMVL